MEIKINIPQNDYVAPTNVRPEIVQGICEAFLAENVWRTFRPVRENPYRQRTVYISRHENSEKFYGFTNGDFSSDVSVRFNGEEMKAAFTALRKAGYHMFRVYSYGSWLGYRCSKKPYMDGGEEVYEFMGFID